VEIKKSPEVKQKIARSCARTQQETMARNGHNPRKSSKPCPFRNGKCAFVHTCTSACPPPFRSFRPISDDDACEFANEVSDDAVFANGGFPGITKAAFYKHMVFKMDQRALYESKYIRTTRARAKMFA
jgi:hypothetical protein